MSSTPKPRGLGLPWLKGLPGRGRRYLHVAAEVAVEVVLIAVFLKLYNHIRNQFGSQKCSPQYALMHAMQVIWVEEKLGLFWEQRVQVRGVQWFTYKL